VALIINVVIVCWLVRGLNSRPLSQGLPAATKSYIWTYYDTVSAHFQGVHMLCYTLILLTTVLCKFNTLGMLCQNNYRILIVLFRKIRDMNNNISKINLTSRIHKHCFRTPMDQSRILVLHENVAAFLF
jgi:hypothetical protein